jgi:hypothetical protein
MIAFQTKLHQAQGTENIHNRNVNAMNFVDWETCTLFDMLAECP